MTATDPSAVLRAAAAKARRLAEGATPGPWHQVLSSRFRGAPCSPSVTTSAESAGRSNIVVDDFLAPGDSAHIAAWHPPVALVVADWLDHEARTRDAITKHNRRWLTALARDYWALPRLGPALAVARELLGDEMRKVGK